MMHWTATGLGFEGRASCPYESSAPYAAQCDLAPQVWLAVAIAWAAVGVAWAAVE